MGDYSKLPFWAKYENRKMYPKPCRIGLHSPVKAEREDGTWEVFCQECFIELTDTDWEKFWHAPIDSRVSSWDDSSGIYRGG